MKKINMSFIVCLFILSSCSVQKAMISDDASNGSLYEVRRIDSNPFMFYIEAVRNDSTFCIISPRGLLVSDTCEIKIGRRYPLHLFRIYPNHLMDSQLIEKIESGEYEGVSFLPVDKKNHNSLYVTSNLNGLILTEKNKREEELIDLYAIQEMAPTHVVGKKRNYVLLLMKKEAIIENNKPD